MKSWCMKITLWAFQTSTLERRSLGTKKIQLGIERFVKYINRSFIWIIFQILSYVTHNLIYFRSSHRRCSVKKDVLKNCVNFSGKHLRCWSLFLIKSQTCNFIKKRLHHRYFPVRFAQSLRTPVLKNICSRLLLLFPQ